VRLDAARGSMGAKIVLTSNQLYWIGRIASRRPHDEFAVRPNGGGYCVLRSLETGDAWIVYPDGRWNNARVGSLALAQLTDPRGQACHGSGRSSRASTPAAADAAQVFDGPRGFRTGRV
jgi:hypothetical protein